MTAFDRARWQAEQLRTFRARVEFLEGERVRCEALIADALEFAATLAAEEGYATTPMALLEVLATRRGFNLARPAFRDEAAVA